MLPFKRPKAGNNAGQITEAQFWSGLVVNEDTPLVNGVPCREWGMMPGMTALNSKGYGVLRWRGRLTYAHRLALELTLGRPLGPGMEACHHCDNPPCGEPLHLFEGTRVDNMQDAKRKGRKYNGTYGGGAS
jgi:hypothetical protein